MTADPPRSRSVLNTSQPTGRRPSGRTLPRAFFNRDPRVVARALLGKLLVRRHRGQILAGRIVEVEAYLGAGDLAAHAAAGRTARNDVLWGNPGYAYVYFIYGMHYCMNVSCLPDGRAGGVLIRALEPVAGLEQMAAARGFDKDEFDSEAMRDRRMLTSGPGRLSEALGITRPRDNGKDLVSANSDLQVRDDGFRARKVAVTPRIGINKSAEMPLRYVIAGTQYLSSR
jgi:DNA-3-methyladenine glycosylase